MIRNKRYIFTTLIILVFSAFTLKGQLSQVQYFMNFPQATQANPAFKPAFRVNIGIPVLSGTYVGLNNNMLSLSEMFQNIPGTDSIMTPLHPDYDREEFLRKLGGTGSISADFALQLLDVGFTVNDWYFDINLAQRGQMAANIPGDLFTLLLEGNEGFVGSTIDLSSFGARAMQYMESSFGASKSIGSKLRVGGRFKILFGGVGASLSAKRFDVDVNNDFSHTLHTDLSLKMSGPFTVTVDEDGLIDDIVVDEDVNPMDILLNTGNSGIAFDFGAQYQLLDNLTLYASIVDLGFIGWKDRTFELKANNNFTFDGFDVSEVIAGDITFDDMITEFTDSLKNSFDFSNSETRFRTGIPGKLFIGANYRPVHYLGLGALSKTTMFQGHVSQSFSLSANLYASDILSTSLVYTMTNRSYANLGFGLAVRMGPAQLYILADQIPFGWDKVILPGESMAISLPDRIDYLNFRFGVNLVFGRAKDPKKDTPMLLE